MNGTKTNPKLLAMQKARHRLTGGNIASAMVSQAIKKGLLPKLDGTISCKDCGKPATHYDHRDYRKMLDVDPVCASCNHRRGPAQHFLSANRKSYTHDRLFAIHAANKRSGFALWIKKGSVLKYHSYYKTAIDAEVAAKQILKIPLAISK